jgi:hypothetical protein
MFYILTFFAGVYVGGAIINRWAKKDITEIHSQWQKRFKALIEKIDTLKDNPSN